MLSPTFSPISCMGSSERPPWSVHPVRSMYKSGHMIHKALDTPLLCGLIGGFGPLYTMARSCLWVMNHFLGSHKLFCAKDQLEHLWKEVPHQKILEKCWVGEKGHPITKLSFWHLCVLDGLCIVIKMLANNGFSESFNLTTPASHMGLYKEWVIAS